MTPNVHAIQSWFVLLGCDTNDPTQLHQVSFDDFQMMLRQMTISEYDFLSFLVFLVLFVESVRFLVLRLKLLFFCKWDISFTLLPQTMILFAQMSARFLHHSCNLQYDMILLHDFFAYSENDQINCPTQCKFLQIPSF